MKLFAFSESRYFGEKVAHELGIALAAHEERGFEDGEHKARPLESVRGEDVFVIQSLHGDDTISPNDKLCRLLFFLATIREHGAQRVHAIAPYLAYARKDRQTKARDPVTTRYVAQLMEAAGADLVMTLDVHNLVAFQNAHRCRTVHLDSRRPFSQRAGELVGHDKVVVASPDPGGVKRAQLFRETFEALLGRPVGSAFMEKRRSAGVVSGTVLAGDVEGATVLVIDDLISSGGTMVRAARACRENGARSIYAFAAHGLFTGDAANTLRGEELAGLFISDTIPSFRLPASAEVETISVAPLFAEAIHRIANNGSLAELLGTTK
jgi:ribose-phosphate pyrophosphokinase